MNEVNQYNDVDKGNTKICEITFVFSHFRRKMTSESGILGDVERLTRAHKPASPKVNIPTVILPCCT